MELQDVVLDIANALLQVDAWGVAFRSFRPGVGPYGEPQLIRLIAAQLNHLPKYAGRVVIRRTPDLLIRGEWAIEFKIARPFGDNAKEAENWSVNLLHPYPGNVSTIGDCYKLSQSAGNERKAVIVIGYEHTPPRIDLTPLVRAFEAIADELGGFRLSERFETRRDGLIHPVHQSLRVFAWEVLAPVI